MLQAAIFKGWLPTERFFQEGNCQLALSLQRGLIELLQQFEQRAHAASAASQNEMPDFIGQMQTTTRCAQLQRTQFVFIGEWAHLENQRQRQA